MAAPDPPPRTGPGSSLLRSIGVLTIAAALVATMVVVVRRPTPQPQAEAEPLQVGLSLPTVATVGEVVPVAIAVAGPEAIERIDLLVEGEIVESVVPNPPHPDVSITSSWMVTAAHGVLTVQGRAVDVGGRVQLSDPALIRIYPSPTVHVVEGPEGESLSEIAVTAGIPAERVAGLAPDVDPDEELAPGSVVFLPLPPLRLDQGDARVALEDGVLVVDNSPPELFVYLRFADSVLRVPDDPGDAIPGTDRIDVAEMLPPLPGGNVTIEVWGRFEHGVELLAELEVPAASLTLPATRLDAMLEVEPLGISVPVPSITAHDAETVRLEWSSNVAHDSMLWFLSTRKPDGATALNPRRVLQNGVVDSDRGAGGFVIDLTDNVFPLAIPAPLSEFSVDSASPKSAGPGTEPLPQGSAVGLGPAWAWVIPVDAAGEAVGPPSNPVRIVVTEAPFDPTGAPPFDVVSVDVVIPPAPNPTLAQCVRVVSQIPPFPAGVGLGVILHPDGSTSPRSVGGIKLTGTLPYTLDETGAALYPFTACPGERGSFQWGDVGCGGDPFCHVSKGITDLTEAAQAFGQFLVDLANELADAYNELKAWAIEQVASTICPDEVAGACRTMIEVAVDALLTSVGVPPTMPNFDDLADVAKGELVDLAMDQMGIGSLCDAVAQAGTNKSCGELAVQLQNMDACSFAPKGEEERCRDLVEDAAAICELASDDDRCELLTKNAQDLVGAGVELVVDESVEAVQAQVSRAALQSIGFPGPVNQQFREHDCRWGGPHQAEVICPPYEPDSSFVTPERPPQGCRVDGGLVVCSLPPGEIVAVPEPLGQHQPIEVKVLLVRNENPLPDDYTCGPLSAVATTITPQGIAGRPYLPATADFPASELLETGLRGLTLWLNEPNPHVDVPEDVSPQPGFGEWVGEAAAAVGDGFGGVIPSSAWQTLLEPGSYVSITVSGDCIDETHGDGLYGIVGTIPEPQPRMTPGTP